MDILSESERHRTTERTPGHKSLQYLKHHTILLMGAIYTNGNALWAGRYIKADFLVNTVQKLDVTFLKHLKLIG